MTYGPVTPTLRVQAMPASIAFYTDVLGFTTKWTWSDTNGFGASAATLACIERGEAVLFLSTMDGGERSSLFIELEFVEDVDRLAAAIGNRVAYDGPADRAWGSRELRLQDPDGHAFRFSCPVDRASEVAGR